MCARVPTIKICRRKADIKHLDITVGIINTGANRQARRHLSGAIVLAIGDTGHRINHLGRDGDLTGVLNTEGIACITAGECVNVTVVCATINEKLTIGNLKRNTRRTLSGYKINAILPNIC